MKQESGQAAEELAARFLVSQGLRVLARNYRCRLGEIDLICEHGDSLVFVEVRLRSDRRFGGAGASISTGKQRRLVAAAGHFLSGKRERPCRFDAVLLDGLDASRIEWIPNAFDAA